MPQQHSIETIELELALLLRRITSITSSNPVENLDRSAYLLLQQIVSHEAAGVKSLAEEFRLDISTVSRQAAALEQKGYVDRIPDPSDRRSFKLRITELGMKELMETKQSRTERIARLLKNWSEEDLEAFGELMKKFNRTFS
ncbi:MarR family transcriptional regulator [Paenibacillus swuensis]|uniref:MarR family transcriptional regulator n=1 Tax=Paenibacillus swuensis TaxID=1178515 RepID=A0A172THG3_9BACL|nr:MarR family transcriptional regulator [Paenibacillus swuensis]ANE46495.1 MarR family transcriptional regulator [Paenibacillus swuensis]